MGEGMLLVVNFYEAGSIAPHRLVAVGSLHKVWIEVPEDVVAEAWKDAFQGHFAAEWPEVLHAAEKSLAHNAASDVYFDVRDLQPLENLTLERLLERTGISRPPNIIVY